MGGDIKPLGVVNPVSLSVAVVGSVGGSIAVGENVLEVSLAASSSSCMSTGVGVGTVKRGPPYTCSGNTACSLGG